MGDALQFGFGLTLHSNLTIPGAVPYSPMAVSYSFRWIEHLTSVASNTGSRSPEPDFGRDNECKSPWGCPSKWGW